MLGNVTNTPASAGITFLPAVKLPPPWQNKALTKEVYFKVQKYDQMMRQLQERNEMCKQQEATNEQLMLDTAELRQSLSRAESELAQERVDREQERSQAAHQNKELRKALRNVRDIVRASLAASRGDPPSVTGQHCAAKKRARFDDQGAQLSPS